MTQDETTKLLAIIKVGYSNFKPDDPKLTIQLWHELLGDLDFAVAQAAVKRLLLAGGQFAPSIGDVRKEAMTVLSPDHLTASDAWGEVLAAVRKHGSYDEAAAMAMMPPTVAKVAKMMSWREICLSENITALRAHFLKMYDSVDKRDSREALMPENMTSIGGGFRAIE